MTISKYAIRIGYIQCKNAIKTRIQTKPTAVATADDCSRVAAHVHWDTTVVAVSPIDTCPPASKSVSKFAWFCKKKKIHVKKYSSHYSVYFPC